MSKSILITVSLACGFVVGAGLDRYMMLDSATVVSTASNTAAVHTSSPPPLLQLQPNRSTSASLDPLQIRAMLREELGTALTAALAGTSSNAGAAKPVITTVSTASAEQQKEAYQAATDLIGGGQWGEMERNSFHQQLAGLDPEMREQAMQKLVQAIDSGALKSPNGGVPLL